MSAKKYDHTPVEAIKHSDKRANIPTEELRDFVAEEERSPKYIVYPRDVSLDPQLVWKGKDEQDSKDLEVPAVPIYVQEKIHPQALIENLRESAKAGQPEPELTLFDDYDGIEFEELIDFYQHEQNWTNRMILGDSLLVMNSLAEKEGLKGQVQMVYLDPPYGIKFGSNWQVSTVKRDVTDGKAQDATRQPEQVKAFRDTWELGIHSYLAYLRDRLATAHTLLGETGSIFVQIGDDNLHLIRSLLDEVFGSENFVLTIIVKKKSATTVTDPVNDYLVWYARDRDQLKVRKLFSRREQPEDNPKFNTLISPDGIHRRVRGLDREEISSMTSTGWRWARVNYPIVSQDPDEHRSKDFEMGGKAFRCGPNKHWRFDPDVGMRRLEAAGRLFDGGGASLGGVMYWEDWPYVNLNNIWADMHGEQDPIYVVQTNRKILDRCILMTTDPGDLVLDPTCGSGTTAYAAEQWGRRWITIDTSRVALALARTRLMAAKYPHYILADSESGRRLQSELDGQLPSNSLSHNDIRMGFVYGRAPHVTLKSIANNQDIRPGMSLGNIDAVIAKAADHELLLDQPYEDTSRVRVAGPFTVESLSPHRMVDIEPASSWGRERQEFVDFSTMILDNLKRAGVQNTRRDERLIFDTLEMYAGEWINAVGEYSDAAGDMRRVAISIGPEHGTVSSDQIKEAAKEAVRGLDFDLLVVLGFAFEAHAGETASEISPDGSVDAEFAATKSRKQLGRLQVLLAQMNPDLAMGDELLKKTGAGNLFMVFGEPDVDVEEVDGGLVVQIRGVDVYDPTTGQVRTASTDDIACWFVDTNYNEESFFVRHAYFTGAGAPYENLKKALRAEIDPDVWATLYSTVSRPFDRPCTGKIAVKVINHYGDEVMKVYEV